MNRALLCLLACVPLALTACDDDGGGDAPITLPDLGGADGATPLDEGARPDCGPDDDCGPQPDMTPDPDAALDLGPDAEPDAAIDLVPDGGPVPGGLCDPCRADGTCAAGGVCLTNNNTGEQFCGSACATDADCARGASCLDLGDVLQCAPIGGTCAAFPPPDLAAPCAGDDDCVNGSDRCVEAGELDYCSVGCATAADCPPGFGRCAEGSCRLDFELGPQGCGRDPTAALPPCGADGACPDGLTCATALLDPLGSTVAPFCTRPCDGGCPAGTACHPTAAGDLCLSPACECLARPPEEALLDDAFELAGVDRCGASFSQRAFDLLRADVARDPFRLSFFDAAHRSATGGLRWATNLQAALDARVGDAAALLVHAAGVVDSPIEAEPRPLDGDDLVAALAAIGAEDPAAVLADVPLALQRDLAPLVGALADIVAARDAAAAVATLDDADLDALHHLMPAGMILRPDFQAVNMTGDFIRDTLTGGFDLAPMYAHARDLLAALEATDWGAHAGAMGFEVSIDTPLGRVIINDAAQQTVATDEAILLLVDTGGDDIYHASVGATPDARHPASLAIELGGNDRYGFAGDDMPSEVADLPPADAAGRYDGSHPQVGDGIGPMSMSTTPRQGAGIVGVGILYDRAGDDTYLSHKLSQGAGVLGLGVLIDEQGLDTYACEQGCQGAASYGIGLHLDRGDETDHYLGVQSVQGYAYVRALGYLHDAGGDDTYRALFGDPELGGVWIYPNAQNETSNSSFAQGSGFGRRADFGDQIFASGGVGVFRDAGEGNDTYQVDVFGQGSGFWFGTGLFGDGGGDDVYEGRWYVQGSGAHFALSFFFEDGGDDTYNRPETIIATATGQGHDLSLGWLVDRGGDDIWHAPGLGLGAGNDNGIGLLVDLGGADTYRVPDARTFGGAAIGDRGAAFEAELCLGVFIDADGIDDYDMLDGTPMGNDAMWSWAERHPDHDPGERGAGIDASGGGLSLP